MASCAPHARTSSKPVCPESCASTSEYYYHVPASELNREQAARLAAIIPSPLKRKPAQMNEYSGEILDRMSKTGW
jgi:monofunctional biosynthetic peptidoglycan transglycosylase